MATYNSNVTQKISASGSGQATLGSNGSTTSASFLTVASGYWALMNFGGLWTPNGNMFFTISGNNSNANMLYFAQYSSGSTQMNTANMTQHAPVMGLSGPAAANWGFTSPQLVLGAGTYYTRFFSGATATLFYSYSYAIFQNTP